MVKEKFHFFSVNEGTISEQINLLDKRKPITYNTIPAKILVENCDIISLFITEMFNESKSKADFPNPLKLADITPAHKKEERTIKKITIDLSVFSHQSQKYLKESCITKFMVI